MTSFHCLHRVAAGHLDRAHALQYLFWEGDQLLTSRQPPEARIVCHLAHLREEGVNRSQEPLVRASRAINGCDEISQRKFVRVEAADDPKQLPSQQLLQVGPLSIMCSGWLNHPSASGGSR